jgi:hypothetical protein
MASIRNIRLTVAKTTGSGDMWDVTVKYDAHFSAHEIANFKYRDGFELWEEDDWPSDDDRLVGGVLDVKEFNPTASPTTRTMKYRVSGSVLDNDDFGNSEIYTWVRLRNLDLNVLYRAKSRVLSVDP